MIIGRNTTFLGRLCGLFWVIVAITFVLGTVIIDRSRESGLEFDICTSPLELPVQVSYSI